MTKASPTEAAEDTKSGELVRTIISSGVCAKSTDIHIYYPRAQASRVM